MARYAAFLRGISISNRRVKNDALRLCCEEMGFVGVAKTLESLLGPWTMRTKGTIDQIAAKHFA